ncbi:hypothetical protein BD410DRAFT_806754 [Rickenella mellea]|uniref:Uncharacterized protein n=1 Tax=Rickenella mellea TaxID=50990 RepID=A0A4Y7PS21_9AGAM|nr:hypothetical protein BD410DRAFT_806754 [Rickenella mellea]
MVLSPKSAAPNSRRGPHGDSCNKIPTPTAYKAMKNITYALFAVLVATSAVQAAPTGVAWRDIAARDSKPEGEISKFIKRCRYVTFIATRLVTSLATQREPPAGCLLGQNTVSGRKTRGNPITTRDNFLLGDSKSVGGGMRARQIVRGWWFLADRDASIGQSTNRGRMDKMLWTQNKYQGTEVMMKEGEQFVVLWEGALFSKTLSTSPKVKVFGKASNFRNEVVQHSLIDTNP